jgi:hypothetical protein
MICKLVGNSRQARASARVQIRSFACVSALEAAGTGAGETAAGAGETGGGEAAAGAALDAWATAAPGCTTATVTAHAIAATNRFMIGPSALKLPGKAG